MKTKRFFIPLFIVLLLSSCNLLGTKGLEKGTFTAIVDGNEVKAFQGRAVYDSLYSFNGTPISFFKLIGQSDSKKPKSSLEFVNIPILEERTYEINNFEKVDKNGLDEIFTLYKNDEFEGVFLSESGTLEITYRDNNSFKGSFRISAYRTVENEPGSYTKVKTKIYGEFYAERGRLDGVIIHPPNN